MMNLCELRQVSVASSYGRSLLLDIAILVRVFLLAVHAKQTASMPLCNQKWRKRWSGEYSWRDALLLLLWTGLVVTPPRSTLQRDPCGGIDLEIKYIECRPHF